MRFRIQHIRPLLLLFLFFGTCFGSFAQELPKAVISGDVKNHITGENIAGATVELYANGTLVETKTTSSNGKFKFTAVEIEKKYKVVFKGSNLVSRFVDIDLTGIPPENTYKKWDLELPMKLVERIPNVDFSTLEPRRSTIMKYNGSSGEIDFNMSEIDTYRKELEKLLKKVDAEKQKQDADKQAQEKKYTDAMAAATAAMNKNDYQTAIAKFQEAKAAKPTEAANLDKQIETANQKYKEFQGTQQYTDLMARADKAMKEKDYAQAKSYYKEAFALKPTEALPQQKLKEIDAQIQKDMESEQKYNEFIAAGNKSLVGNKFDDAIASFNEALKLRPGDTEATTGLNNAKKAKDDANKDAAAKAAKEKEFNDLVIAADKEFTAKNYDAAIKKYDEALAKMDNADVKKKKFDAEAAKKKFEDDQAAKAAADQKKKEYDKFMADGSTALTAKNYDDAINKFKSAVATGVNDLEAQKKVVEAEAAKAAAAKADADKQAADKKKADFDAFIASGDTKLGAKDFQNAVEEYKKALALKVDDVTANTKIKAAADAKLAYDKEQADKQAADAAAKKKIDFDAFIAAGDAKLTSKDFDRAVEEFKKALALKVDDATANAKIKSATDAKAAYEKELADKAIADMNAKKKTDFDGFIAAGDTKLGAKDYDNAIVEYKKALALKFDDTAANNKIKEATDAKAAYAKEQADKLAADAAAKTKADFDAFVASGDTKLGAKDFDNAIGEYKKALVLKVDDVTANNKIKAATDAKAAYAKEQSDKLAADAAAKAKADFDAFVASGDTKLGTKDFDNAIGEYKKALTLKVDDVTANNKIKAATDAKAAYVKEQADKLAADAAAKAKADFDAFIASGDTKLGAKDFDNAIGEYKKALVLKVDDVAANNKIKAATDAKAAYAKEQADKLAADADAKQKKKLYDETILKAQKDFDAGEFQAAIDKYNTALSYVPEDPFAKGQIEKANQKLKEKQEFAEKELQKLLDVADKEFAAGNFADAKGYYERYTKQRPDNTYAQGRIKECDDKIKEQALNDANAKKKTTFDGFITAGDTKLGAKDFDNAIAEYKKALDTKFDDVTANTKIKEATDAKAAYAKEQSDKLAADAAAKLRADFDAFIASGDTKANIKDFDNAIGEYKKALALKVDDVTANNKIKEATDAKAAYTKEQADKLAADAAAKRKADFDAFIASGDTKVGAKDFDKAMDEYKKALALKVDDATANQKIADAVTAKDQWLKEQASLADKAKNKKLYDETILKAQKDFDAGEFQAAIDKYNTALTYVPDDVFAKGQIEKANQKLKEKQEFAERELQKLLEVADQQFTAGNFTDAKGYYERYVKQRPDNTYAQGRIKECDDKIKEANANAAAQAQVEAKYKDFMAKGKTAFDAKKFDEAIALYDGALGVKAGDADATNKKELALRAKQDALSAAENAVLKKKYDDAIKKANAKFDAGDFKASITDYTEALSYIPNDKFATDRIALANERMNSKAKEAEEMLAKLLSAADNSFNEKNWSEAKGYYERYLKQRPDNTYAQGRIKECEENIKADMANAANKAALDAKYRKFMEDGEKLAGTRNYDQAIQQFTSALDLKPGDATAQKRIDDMNKLKNDLFKLANQKAAEREAKEKYDAAIAEGNAQLSGSNFDPAIAAYREALGYKPNDKYASDQIKRCIKLKSEKEKELESMYNSIVKKADELFDAKNYGEAKGYYERAQKMRGTDPYPPQRIEECDKQLNKIADANKGYTLEHSGTIVTDQTLLEGQRLLEEAKRQEKYQAEQEYVEINDRNQKFQSEVSTEQVKGTYTQQDSFNLLEDSRSKLFRDMDNYRLQKVDSTHDYIDEREKQYALKNEHDELAGYNRQQQYNQDNFDREGFYRGKDAMREYKADSVKLTRDQREAYQSDMNKNHDVENYNLKSNMNEEAYQREQLFKQKDQMREYKADSVKFTRDQREAYQSQMNKNHDVENYNLKSNMNEEAYQREQLFKQKDQMREYKADSVKLTRDIREEAQSDANKNRYKENFDLQANLNNDEFQREQMFKAKDAMREYKADSVKFTRDQRESYQAQMNKNHDVENYNLQANLNNDEFQREQIFKGKDAMREYKADSVKLTRDQRESYQSQMNKNHDVENYNLKSNMNEEAYQREQQFKQKDQMREYKADSVKFTRDLREQAQSDANKNRDKENYTLQANLNNDEYEREQMFKEKDNKLRGETVKQTQQTLDNNTQFLADASKTNQQNTSTNNNAFIKDAEVRSQAERDGESNYLKASGDFIKKNDDNAGNLKSYSKAGDEQVKQNNETFKTTSPVVPKNYDTGHLAQLASDYGPGIHQWTTNKYNGNKVVTEIIVRRIVVKGNTANDYMMTQSRWGVAYSKNGQPIGEHVWEIETGGNLIVHDK